MKKKTFIVIIEGKIYAQKVYDLIHSLMIGIPEENFELIKIKDGNSSSLNFYNRLQKDFGANSSYLEKRSNSYIKVLKDPFIIQLTEVLGGAYSRDENVLDDVAVANSAGVIKHYVTDAYPVPTASNPVPKTDPKTNPNPSQSKGSNTMIYIGAALLLFLIFKK